MTYRGMPEINAEKISVFFIIEQIFLLMEKGIICFETGEFKQYRTENQFAALPLLEFMKQQMKIDYVYRQIVTREELEYYLKKIADKHFQNKFGVVYFSFHGAPGVLSLTRNGKNNISLDEIADMVKSYDSFLNRHIHFSTCETLKCDEEIIKRFKREVGARTISGYTEQVDSTAAFINELAYFHQIFKYTSIATYKKHMADYQNQLNKLGFTIV